MNLIDLLPLTKRQREELAKEMGIVAVGRESLCEKCMNFGILCIPQNLP